MFYQVGYQVGAIARAGSSIWEDAPEHIAQLQEFKAALEPVVKELGFLFFQQLVAASFQAIALGRDTRRVLWLVSEWARPLFQVVDSVEEADAIVAEAAEVFAPAVAIAKVKGCQLMTKAALALGVEPQKVTPAVLTPKPKRAAAKAASRPTLVVKEQVFNRGDRVLRGADAGAICGFGTGSQEGRVRVRWESTGKRSWISPASLVLA